MTSDAFVHPALFYRSRSEYVAGTVPFLREGLAAGEAVAASVPSLRLAWLRESLGDDADRVTLMDMGQVGRNPGRIIPSVLRAFADAHPSGRVRIIGEPIWPGRTDTEYPACVQHEALINLAFDGRAVTILCPYDAAGLDARALDDAWRTHPVVVDAGGERSSVDYDPAEVIAAYNAPLAPPPGSALAFVDFDVSTLDIVRAGAVSVARRLGLAEDRLGDFALVVSELVSNSVSHGGGRGRLRIWAEDSHVACEVCDNGTITDPLAGRRPVGPRSTRGRGLLLINQVADLVRVHTGATGTTVRAYFRGAA